MADVKKVISIEVDTDTGAVKKLNKDLEQTEKQSKKSTKGIGRMAKGFKAVGTAIKATGIGLLLGLLAKMSEVLGRNQKVLDATSTAMNFLSIAFNDFFSFISDNISTVTDYFKELFENPGDKLREIADTIKNYVISNVQLLIKGFGTLGEAMGYLFDGEFSKAFETAKKGAAEVGEAIVKLNPATAIVANLAEAVYDNRDAIMDYTKSTLEQAQAMTEATNSMEGLEIQSRRLQLEYQKQAEELRQIRDDESRTIEERIDANRRLGEVLIESAKVEKSIIDQRIAAVQMELDANKGNIELQNQIAALKVEQLDIDERISGFRSEQLTNENSLLREQEEVYKQLDELRIQRTMEGVEKELALNAMKYDELFAQARGNAELEQELLLAQEYEAAQIREKFRAQEEEEEKRAAAEKKRLKDQDVKDTQDAEAAKRQVVSGTAQLSSQLIQEVASLTGEEGKRAFQVQKAANIAAAVTNTAVAVTGALTAGGNPLKLATGAQFVEAALVGSLGAIQIAKIASTKYGGGGGGSSSSGGGRSGGGDSPNVQFNTVGASGINQLNESIVAQNEPVKAYVVSTEVSNAQSLDRNRQSNATFG